LANGLIISNNSALLTIFLEDFFAKSRGPSEKKTFCLRLQNLKSALFYREDGSRNFIRNTGTKREELEAIRVNATGMYA
jgi:hypothetical protein